MHFDLAPIVLSQSLANRKRYNILSPRSHSHLILGSVYAVFCHREEICNMNVNATVIIETVLVRPRVFYSHANFISITDLISFYFVVVLTIEVIHLLYDH